MTENEIATVVVNCLFNVHKQLGPGLLESIYEECVYCELDKAGLDVKRQQPFPVFYKEEKIDIGFRVDFLINSKLILELKAVEALHDVHKAQVITYLKLSG